MERTAAPIPAQRATLWLGIVLTIGVALSLLAFHAAQRRRAAEIEKRAVELTLSRVEKLRVSILRSMEVLHSLAAMHGLEGPTDRSRFRAFVQPALRRQPELLALSWNPVVAPAQREAHEAMAQRSGIEGYWIHGQGADGSRLPPQDTEYHVPVGWIEPFERNASVAGFDLISDPSRRESLEHARDTGTPVATAPLRLAQAKENPAGFLVMLPVYAGNELPPSIELRRSKLTGFYVAVFRMADLVSGTLEELSAQGIDARLIDESPLGGCILGGEARPGDLRIPFEVATRQWSLAFAPKPSFESADSRYTPWLVLVAGLVCAALTTGYLYRGWKRVTEVDAVNLALRREVTDRQRAEQAAEAANRAKSEFLANMSHEIRTPLNAILGYAQILQRDARIETEQRDAVGGIATSGHHLLGLLNEVLDLSKIEAGRMELRLAPVHLGALLRGLAVTFNPLCLRKRLTFRLEMDESTCGWVWGDESKLRQVLINLCGNAVKFTEHGVVILRATRREADVWQFEVCDTGPGILEADQERIFEPFQQGSDRSHDGGTGLGLAIARKQVALMNGTLQVESSPGSGARFSFAIELSEAPAIARSPLPERSLDSASEFRVLVVDDYPQGREALSGVLRSAGCEVEMASDGTEAVRTAWTMRPQLVLLDVLMPGPGIEETVRSLRSAAGPGLKILAHSASNALEVRETALRAGCDAFLSKPIRFEELFAFIENQFGLRIASPASPACCDPEGTPLPSLEGLRVELPEDLSARLSVAAELHSATALKSALMELRRHGDGGCLLAEHIRLRMRAYDMAGIQRLLSDVVCLKACRSTSEAQENYAGS